jgi:hypothetical protein
MTDQELRALVRDVIARSGIAARHAAAGPSGVGAAFKQPIDHSSHGLFNLAPADPEGRCVIEPAVQCNHCGYCKSYGH